MRQIGTGCNIFVFTLYCIFFLFFSGLLLIIDLPFGIFVTIISLVFLAVQWRLKNVYLTNKDITIISMFGKKRIYPLNEIRTIGYFGYPLCYIELQNDDFFIFQIPLKYLFIGGKAWLGKKDYLTEIQNYITKWA
jgi:hypothetical protein